MMVTEEDIASIEFIHDRLLELEGVSSNTDYFIKARSVTDKMYRALSKNKESATPEPNVNMKQNLDQHLFSEEEGNHFSPKCFMTKDRKLGIDVGGSVRISDLKFWYESMDQLSEARKLITKLSKTPQWPAFLITQSDGKVKIDPSYSDSASTYKCGIETFYKNQLFKDLYLGKSPEECLMGAYNSIAKSIECKKLEDNLADKGYLYQCGIDHPKDYCDQCGNTGFSLFDGAKCDCKGDTTPPEPNVKKVDNLPILKQIEHYQRQITDAWTKINKLIRESEEK